MTLDEKVGQMTQADQDFLKDIGDIRKYYLGSLLNGGDSDPKAGNSLAAWTDMYDRYQSEALQTRLFIPLLYGVDAVHGHNNVLGAVVFPHDIGLGATRNATLVEDIERMTAEEVKGTGGRLDQGDTRLSEAELRRIHLPGYPRAIEAGVGSIMVSYNSWNGEKLSGSKHLLTDVLKHELGFDGFLI